MGPLTHWGARLAPGLHLAAVRRGEH